jgi:hypothetical protein
MRQRTLPEPVEAFTISVSPEGLMSLQWDRTAWDVDIVVQE